jgi:hypothetical protein
MKDVCSSGCTAEQTISYRRNMKFELHDLNGDRVPELFVYIQHSDWCGASFNCDYWVFYRKHNVYHLIAAGYPVLQVANTVTKGFRDLESRGHLGSCTLPNGDAGWQTYLHVLRYNGAQYNATEIGPRCLSK